MCICICIYMYACTESLWCDKITRCDDACYAV